jgi:hypothetical protein
MIVGLPSDYHPQVLVVKHRLIHQTLRVLIELPLSRCVFPKRCPLVGQVFLRATQGATGDKGLERRIHMSLLLQLIRVYCTPGFAWVCSRYPRITLRSAILSGGIRFLLIMQLIFGGPC